MKFIANTAINHDGEIVEEGGILECDKKDILSLLKSGAVTPKRKQTQRED